MKVRCLKGILFVITVASFALGSVDASAASARENYEFYCAQCHGLDGRGDGPNATDSQPVDPRNHRSAYEMSKLTDSEIMDVIREGGSATSKSTLMPPFGKTLTEREIRELKDYLRRLCRCGAHSS